MVRLCILVAFALVLSPQTSPKLESYDVADAYEVYAAILPSEWPWKDAHAKWLVIRQTTTAYEMCVSPDAASAKVIGSAIADYIQQNRVPRALLRNFVIEKPYTLLSPAEERAAFQSSPGGWDGFYQMYADSGGLTELSAVGFNAEKTIAVVYAGHSCGMLCGGGGFHVLQKKAGKWENLTWEGSTCMWVS